jgi:RNA polymerase sigma-70 factor (ECF subfamily)
VVHRELPRFQRARTGAFRAWLRGILANRLRAFWRDRQRRPLASGDSDLLRQLEQLEDPGSDLSRRWDEEHDRHVIQQLLRGIEQEFMPATWQAFRRQVLDEARASVVAAELGMSVNAVLIARSRVLRRLRREACGLID